MYEGFFYRNCKSNRFIQCEHIAGIKIALMNKNIDYSQSGYQEGITAYFQIMNNYIMKS